MIDDMDTNMATFKIKIHRIFEVFLSEHVIK